MRNQNAPSLPMSLSWKLSLVISLCVLATVTVPGCGGCFKLDPIAQRKKDEEEKKKKKAKPEKPKEDFELGQLIIHPAGVSTSLPAVKQGHWITASQQMKANNFHFSGELVSKVTDRYGKPIDVADSLRYLSITRPAALPKGQLKYFETTYYVPRSNIRQGEAIYLQSRLLAKRGGRERAAAMARTRTIPDYRYMFVVLSSEPDKYGYLKRLDSISPEMNDDLVEEKLIYYEVALPNIARRVPLPSHGMTWSHIAFVLWDDLDPQQLTPDQQLAMLDWLHWGGQLIISGPDALHLLQQKKSTGPFLEELLPAIKQGVSTVLQQADFNEINGYWSLKEKGSDRRRELQIVAKTPPVGIVLAKHSDAQFLPHTGSLLAERRVGRGRIVVTAFSLTERQVVNWPSFDGFFNACVLRRPRRSFSEAPGSLGVQTAWSDHRGLEKDARLISTLRYFTRDIGHPVPLTLSSNSSVKAPWLPEEEEVAESQFNPYGYDSPPPTLPRITLAEMDSQGDHWHFGGYRPWARSGVAGWNDGSGASTAARDALLEAAGITIPPPQFVLKMLVIYLVILVPVNWSVFRLLGHVEWAWLAVPVIAIAGALMVIRSAQLDIGFARSRTEIVVLEGYGGYQRGHATRYTALYNSLSTDYQMLFDDPNALAQPFSMGSKSRPNVDQRLNEVSLIRDSNARLGGFTVASNSTGMVHSEHMVDLGDGFRLVGDDSQGDSQGLSVKNGTKLQLKDVAVLRRTTQGALELAWVGQFEPGHSVSLKFSPAVDNLPRPEQWNDSPAMFDLDAHVASLISRHDTNRDKRLQVAELAALSETPPQLRLWDRDRNGTWNRSELKQWAKAQRRGQFGLGELVNLASRRLRLAKGEVRLIGWTDQPLEGVTLRPSSAQVEVRMLVLIHLRSGELPTPLPDENCRADIKIDALNLFPDPEN